MNYRPRRRLEVIRLPSELFRIQLVGWVCQDRLRAHQSGLPITVVGKTLANVIYEANFRQGAGHAITPFLGYWTPHRFGAVFSLPDRLLRSELATRTGRAYLNDLAQDQDLAETIGLEIIPDAETGAKATEGRASGIEDEGQRSRSRVRFSSNPSAKCTAWFEDEIVTAREYQALIDLTGVFTEMYRAKAEYLNTFATCRTVDTTVTAIDTEVIYCKEDVEFILSAPWHEHNSDVRSRLNAARACASQIGAKLDMYRSIREVATGLAARLTPFPLGAVVLASAGDSVMSESLALRSEWQAQLVSATDVLAACLSLLGCYPLGEDARLKLGRGAAHLRDQMGMAVDGTGLAKLRKDRPRMRRELEQIMSTFWREFERRYGLGIPSVTLWYQMLEDDPLAKLT